MSSCSRQYASRHITGLRKAYDTTSFASAQAPRIARQKPLLFLYPSCFRQCWHHQYHTDPERGQDRRRVNKASDWQPIRQATKITSHSASSSKQRASPPIDPLKPSLARKTHRSKPRDERYGRDVDAQKVFAALSSALNDIGPVVENEAAFTIAKSHAKRLAGHADATAWVHYEDTGCIIKLKPDSKRDVLVVSLDGSERARELASDFIKSFAYRNRGTQNQRDSLAAWLHAIKHSPAKAGVCNLPEPPQWTVQTFYRYVQALTKKRHRHGLDRWKYWAEQNHNIQIAGKLVDMFAQHESARFASSAALELALKFCRHHTELSRAGGEIWNAAKLLGIPFEIAAYNEELRRCLVLRNGRDIMEVVNKMRDEQVRPNEDTWSIVLQYAESSESHFHILRVCLENGMLNLSDHNSTLVETVVKGEMINYLSQPDGLLAFMEDMDDAFGEHWLTTRVLVRMLRVCRIGQARVETASLLLAEIAKRADLQQLMNRPCLVELVKIAKKAGNLRDALEVVQSKVVQDDLDLHESVLEPLFHLAWKTKSINVCRLLWMFGCTWGKTTFSMKDMLWHSMQGNSYQSSDARSRHWQKIAGKLIVSQAEDIHELKLVLPHLFGTGTEPSVLSKQLEWTNGPARHEQLQLAQLLIERDFSAWRFYYPIPLHEMHRLLTEALNMDRELTAADTWRKIHIPTVETLFAKMQNLNLKPRPAPLQHQKGDRKKSRRVFSFNGILLDYNTLRLAPDDLRRQMYNPGAKDSERTTSSSDVPSLDQFWPLVDPTRFEPVGDSEHFAAVSDGKVEVKRQSENAGPVRQRDRDDCDGARHANPRYIDQPHKLDVQDGSDETSASAAAST